MIRVFALAVFLGGCTYRTAVRTTPAGAQLELPDGSLVSTPTTVTLRSRLPLGRARITATASGFRPLTVRLPRGEVDLILVPEHDGAGTWSADQIP